MILVFFKSSDLKMFSQWHEKQSDVLGLIKSCYHIPKHGPKTWIIGTGE
jgi:hypothetical protein